MEFQEAYDKLQELAKGRYHSIRFEMDTYSDGKRKTEVRLYIGDASGCIGEARGSTWQEAFYRLDGKTVEEIPDVSDAQEEKKRAEGK